MSFGKPGHLLLEHSWTFMQKQIQNFKFLMNTDLKFQMIKLKLNTKTII